MHNKNNEYGWNCSSKVRQPEFFVMLHSAAMVYTTSKNQVDFIKIADLYRTPCRSIWLMIQKF